MMFSGNGGATWSQADDPKVVVGSGGGVGGDLACLGDGATVDCYVAGPTPLHRAGQFDYLAAGYSSDGGAEWKVLPVAPTEVIYASRISCATLRQCVMVDEQPPITTYDKQGRTSYTTPSPILTTAS